jgi:hypothetical protein
MKRPNQEQLESMSCRNDTDMRMVGGIIGIFVGGFIGLYLEARVLRHIIHLPAWALIAGLVLAACIGGIVGYFKDSWRSSS